MRQFVLIILSVLALSFACSKTQPKPQKRAPNPGISPGRIDPLEDKYFIKRYEGYLGNDKSIPVNMLLVNWGNGRLTGQTYYPNHHGILKFEGKLNNDNSFEYIEERFDRRNASFSGIIHSPDKISGTWWNVDSSKNMNFEYTEVLPDEDYDLWTGAWHLNDPWDTTIIIIGGVTERTLNFAINIYTNNYQEEFLGTADIRGTRAVFDEELFPIYRENCHIVFHRRGREVYLDEKSFPFLCGLGPNCWINGTYKDIYSGKEARMNFIGKDSVFVDTATYEAFYEIVGPENLKKFAYNMERLEKVFIRDDEMNILATSWRGRVRGFHREKEGVIVYDDSGNIWAATTTPPTSFMGPMKVHYFTNDVRHKKKMHFSIKDWMKHFNNCTVVYESD